MAWDKDHIRRLLNEVRNTKGVASLRKSEELLDYVTTHSGAEKSKRETSAEVPEQDPYRPEPA
jgi:hypothetical protein